MPCRGSQPQCRETRREPLGGRADRVRADEHILRTDCAHHAGRRDHRVPAARPMLDSYPSGIATGPDGNLWFPHGVHGDRLRRITPAGTITDFPVPPGSATTNNVAGPVIQTGPDGNLWFSGYNAISSMSVDG